MDKITKFDEYGLNERSNAENLKLILSSLKDATEEQIDQVSTILGKRLTFGSIKDLAEIFHVEDKIVK